MSFQAYPHKKCGFSISNHSIGTSRSAELRDNTISGAVGQFVKVPGLIEAVKVTLTEKKEEMTFVTISNEYWNLDKNSGHKIFSYYKKDH
jgi:hypothetical protein